MARRSALEGGALGMGIFGTLLLAACGGGAVTPDTPEAEPSRDRPSSEASSQVRTESAVGALDKAAVKSAVASLNADVQACVQQGQKRLPFLDGDIEVFVQVDAMGRAEQAYLTRSSLGDHDVELCILEHFRRKGWPRPVGGQQGEIVQSFSFQAGHLEPPDRWSASKLAEAMKADDPGAFGALEAKLAGCRQEAGTGPMQVTMYLDEDGLVRTAGAGMSDPEGEAALTCVVTTLQTTSFPAPGGNFVKVTLDI